MSAVIIFAGPTLSPEVGRQELEAVWLPPVAQGDVYRAARRGAAAIGLIDGYFDHVPAVWHKEILWAMSQGIRVYGSASMGALRAAELDVFGMRGVGRVYEWFKQGVLEDDDEVAVVHQDDDGNHGLLSEAMVNIRATLQRALEEEVLSAGSVRSMTALAKATYYPQRSFESLLRASAAHVAEAELQAFREWLPHGQVDQKRLDAISMLRTMRADLSAGHPMVVDYTMEHTDFWSHVIRAETEGAFERDDAPGRLPSDGVLEELRLQGAPYLRARDEGLLRDLALREGQSLGHGAGDAAVVDSAEKLRRDLELDDDGDWTTWLDSNDTTPGRFRQLAAGEASVVKLRWARGGGQQLLDRLRVDGRYGRLRARASSKDAALAAAGHSGATIANVGIGVDELMAWYFQRLGPLYRADPRRHARDYGFASFDQFVDAVLREYLYVNDGTLEASRRPAKQQAQPS